MKSTVHSKLRFVYANSPLAIQPRIARVINAISNSKPHGIDSPLLKKVKVQNTSLSLLEENADSFLALMRTLPKKHPFKETVEEMSSLAEKLSAKIEESGQELSKILQTDEQDLPGIKSSALGELADLIQTESSKIADLKELTKTLSTLAGKVHKEEKSKPVEHDMPSKDVGSKNKKKKSEEEGISEEIPEIPGAGAAGAPGKGTPIPGL